MNKASKSRKTDGENSQSLDAAVRLFKALSHPARVRIAARLLRGDCCVSEARDVLGISQPNASQHLKILKEAGLIAGRRQGTKICYRLADPRLARILHILFSEENER